MRTKFRIAQKAASVGISTIIANGKRRDILKDICQRGICRHQFQSEKPSLQCQEMDGL